MVMRSLLTVRRRPHDTQNISAFSIPCFPLLGNRSIAFACMHEVKCPRKAPDLLFAALRPGSAITANPARSRLMCARVPHASVCSAGIPSIVLRSTTTSCDPICLPMQCGCFTLPACLHVGTFQLLGIRHQHAAFLADKACLRVRLACLRCPTFAHAAVFDESPSRACTAKDTNLMANHVIREEQGPR